MKDLFGRNIVPGDSFLRIEDKMGGSILRYYFLGATLPDGKIQVQEYGGVPRSILVPCEYKNTLILLTEDLMKLSKLTPPNMADVNATKAPAKKKATKAEPLEL